MQAKAVPLDDGVEKLQAFVALLTQATTRVHAEGAELQTDRQAMADEGQETGRHWEALEQELQRAEQELELQDDEANEALAAVAAAAGQVVTAYLPQVAGSVDEVSSDLRQRMAGAREAVEAAFERFDAIVEHHEDGIEQHRHTWSPYAHETESRLDQFEQEADVAAVAIERGRAETGQALEQLERWLDDALSPWLSRIGEASAVDASLKYGGVANDLGLIGDELGLLTSVAQQYRSSPCVTTVGKMVDATLGVYLAHRQNAMPAGLQAADAVGGLALDKVEDLPATSVGDFMSSAVHSSTVLAEGIVLAFVDGDTNGWERFHQESLAGQHNPAFKFASELGDSMEKHMTTAFLAGGGFEMAALGASPVAAYKLKEAP